MEPFTTSRIDDLPQIWDGFGKLVRAGLGISAFGCNVLDVPPDYATSAHDESDSEQEELYIALSGGGALLVGPEGAEQEVAVTPETVTRVSADARRVFRSGPDGCRLLVVGGKPGKGYIAPDWSSQA